MRRKSFLVVGASAIFILISVTSFSADNTALNVKPSGNVGIGTTTPAAKLDVIGNVHATGDICTDVNGRCLSSAGSGGGGSSVWNVDSSGNINYSSGNVGIGTSAPTNKLEIIGNTLVTGDSTVTGNSVVNGNVGIGTTSPTEKLQVTGNAVVTGNSTITGNSTVTGNSIINGNVGIGTSNPVQKLSVAGTIESTSGGFKFPNGTTQSSAATNGSLECILTAEYSGSAVYCPSGYQRTGCGTGDTRDGLQPIEPNGCEGAGGNTRAICCRIIH